MTTVSFSKVELDYLMHIIDVWYVDEGNDRTKEEIIKEKRLFDSVRSKILYRRT